MIQKRDWLIKLRIQQGLTHQNVADAAGIKRTTYTTIELGCRNPSVETAKKIADVLKFEWTIFFAQPCHMRKQNPVNQVGV